MITEALVFIIFIIIGLFFFIPSGILAIKNKYRRDATSSYFFSASIAWLISSTIFLFLITGFQPSKFFPTQIQGTITKTYDFRQVEINNQLYTIDKELSVGNNVTLSCKPNNYWSRPFICTLEKVGN